MAAMLSIGYRPRESKKRPNATTMRRNLKYSKSDTKDNATSTKKEKKNASTNGLRKLKRKNPKVITNLYVKYVIYYIYVIYVIYLIYVIYFLNFKYHAFRNVERTKISMISTRSTHMLKKQNSKELNGTMHRLIANQYKQKFKTIQQKQDSDKNDEGEQHFEEKKAELHPAKKIKEEKKVEDIKANIEND